MRIDVWSDVVCPWCYLGSRRLDAALELVDDADELEVRWRAYQLDPTAGPEAKPLKPAIEAKYGPGAFDGMVNRLVPLGAEVGIDYRFDDVQRVTSVPALMLVAWVERTHGHAVAEQLHERLFRAYFTDGDNVADPANLVRWAVEVGVDEAEAADAVASGAGREAVAADLTEAADKQITGVPAFVLADAWIVPGAQDVEVLATAITRARERLAP